MAGLLSYVVSKPESPGAGNTIRAPEPLQCGHSRPALPLCDGAMSRVTDHLKFASAHLPWGSRRPRPFLAPSNSVSLTRHSFRLTRPVWKNPVEAPVAATKTTHKQITLGRDRKRGA